MGFGYVLLTLVISIAVFLLFRNITLWYFKINRIIELLEQQNKFLSSMVDGGIRGSSSSGSGSYVRKLMKTCKSCKKEVDGSYTACPHCGSNSWE